MSAYKLIEQKVSSLPLGAVVTLDEFNSAGSRSAVVTALARLTKKNVLVRVRRGLYLKPKQSKLGTLPPSREAVISAITQKGSKSYLSGLSAFNRLGLTTQVPNVFTLKGGATNTKIKIGGTRIEIKAGKSPKSIKDIPLLMLLDSMREIKKIPDTSVEDSLQILKGKIGSLDLGQKLKLIDLALEDKPMVRAILGAILDELNPELTTRLAESMNPLTSFILGETSLKFEKKWKIK
jgi:hypothetical protein